MFPYVCLATMPIFCRSYHWPRKLRRGDNEVSYFQGRDLVLREERAGPKRKRSVVTRKQKFVAGLLIAHVAVQLFLPYSHFITKVGSPFSFSYATMRELFFFRGGSRIESIPVSKEKLKRDFVTVLRKGYGTSYV